MRICIATFATGSYAPLCDITDPNKREYSARNGYDFLRNHDDVSGNVFFQRHQWHLKIIESGLWDWLYCLDADAIFTNLRIRIESVLMPSDKIVFPLDAVMVQAGGFLIGNCDLAKDFLRAVVARGSADPNQSDQIEMENLLPQFKDAVRFLPQRVMGSYQYHLYPHLGGNYVLRRDRNGNDGQWQAGDFVLHVPGATMETKCAVLRQHLALVQR